MVSMAIAIIVRAAFSCDFMGVGSCKAFVCDKTPPVWMVRQLLCHRFSSKWKAVGDIGYIAESAIYGKGKQLEGERMGLKESRLTIVQYAYYFIVMVTLRTV